MGRSDLKTNEQEFLDALIEDDRIFSKRDIVHLPKEEEKYHQYSSIIYDRITKITSTYVEEKILPMVKDHLKKSGEKLDMDEIMYILNLPNDQKQRIQWSLKDSSDIGQMISSNSQKNKYYHR